MTYHWCTNHQYWTLHSSTECKGIKVTSNKRKNQSKASNADKRDTTSQPNKLLHAINALVSLLDCDEESEQESGRKMRQRFATIFQRPFADTWTTILTLWVILWDPQSCGLFFPVIIVGLTFCFHVLLQSTASKCQQQKPSKRATSEWLKWQRRKGIQQDPHQ